MNRRPTILMLLICVCGSLVWGQWSAQAVGFTWTNTVGGAWTTSGSWDQTGEPDDATDTAALGNLSGPYTVTLGANRTISALTLSGADPTLSLGSTLTLSAGTSTISGGLLTGTGTLEMQSGAVINWSAASAPGGSLNFVVPINSSSTLATLNNTSGAWGIAAGQKLRIQNNYTGDSATHTFAVTGGFTNSGEIHLGSQPPGDNPAPSVKLDVTGGPLVNTATGQILLYPRGDTGSLTHNPWSERFVSADVNNSGQIICYTPFGTLGRSGATITNSGTISVMHNSAWLSSGVPSSLRITGSSFVNTGTLDFGSNRLTIDTTTFTHNGGAISGSGTLALGLGAADRTVNWNGPDLSGPATLELVRSARVTLNRSSTWNLLSGQTLYWPTGFAGAGNEAGSSIMRLTVNQDLHNSGLIKMGNPAPGDNYGVHELSFTSGKLVNNPAGVITMYPRSASNFGYFDTRSWSYRAIAGEVDNQGLMNVLSWDSYIGKAGANNLNSGTIAFDSSITEANGYFATLNVTGASFTNQAGGRITGKGTLKMPAGVPLINQGVLAGNVTVNGSVIVAAGGIVSPGSSASAGTVTVTNGNLTMASGSVLDVELLSAGAYDVLEVLGGVTLTTPTLQINLGYSPGTGDVFYILRNDGVDAISGAFLSGNTVLTLPFTGDGRQYWAQVSYAAIAGSALSGGNDIALYDFVAIPEPSVLLLLAVGGLALWRTTRPRAAENTSSGRRQW